jgi:hypothetical protein
MGPFPALAPLRNSSILTGLNAFLTGFCPPIRGLHLVYAAWEIPDRKPQRSPPKTHLRRLFPAARLGFCRKIVFREPRL